MYLINNVIKDIVNSKAKIKLWEGMWLGGWGEEGDEKNE